MPKGVYVRKKGIIPWNKGKVGVQICSDETKLKRSLARLGTYHSEETKLKMSLARLGTHPTEETKLKLSESRKSRTPNLGNHHSDATKLKMSLACSGEKHRNWKGGISPINMAIRNSFEYKNWRKAVFERDGYICQMCGVKSGKGKTVYLHSHHIKSFTYYSELRFDIDNGLTLCKTCHEKIPIINNKFIGMCVE